jgi:hypothetical protein
MPTELDEDFQDEIEVEDEQEQSDEVSGTIPETTPGQDEEQTDSAAGAEEQVRDEPRQVSRAERRFQALANQAKAADERAAKMERELQEFRAERQRHQSQVQEKEPTQEEMSMWSTDQVVQYRLDKATSKFNQTLSQMQFQALEATDKSSYDSLCATDARAKKYSAEVEQKLTDLRMQGQNAPRAQVLRWLIGDKLLNQAPKDVEKQRKRGAENIVRQRGSQPAPRSDQTSTRGAKSEAEKRRQRLENITF